MLGIRGSFNIPEVERRLDRLGDAMDQALSEAVRLAGNRIAESARQTHPYTNRTGNLQASTQAIEPSGSFRAGTLEGGVEATEFYAEFVDAMPDYEFLRPAYLYEREEVDQIFQQALEYAARVGGMA